MTAAVLGKWKLVSSENFDDFMKAIGVGMVMRKLASTAKPVLDVTQDGDEWCIKTETTIKTSYLKFKLGEKFEQERMDGVKVESIITVEDDKLVEKQLGDKEVTIVREIVNGELRTTCTIGEVKSVRVYQKV